MFQTRLPRLSCTERAYPKRSAMAGRDVGEVGFPVQDVYKMTYGDENTTFKYVNGYLLFL